MKKAIYKIYKENEENPIMVLMCEECHFPVDIIYVHEKGWCIGCSQCNLIMGAVLIGVTKISIHSEEIPN